MTDLTQPGWSASEFQVQAYEEAFETQQKRVDRARDALNLLKAQRKVIDNDIALVEAEYTRVENELKRLAQWLLDNDPAMKKWVSRDA